MDFKIIFKSKICLLVILLTNGVVGVPIPDTKTTAPELTGKAKMECNKQFCTLFPGICGNGGTCVPGEGEGEGCAGSCRCTKHYKGRFCETRIVEDYNGNSNDNGNDNKDNGNDDNGKEKHFHSPPKKPALGVIMKLFKGLRSNGNGETALSKTATDGKSSPSNHGVSPSNVTPVKTSQTVKSSTPAPKSTTKPNTVVHGANKNVTKAGTSSAVSKANRTGTLSNKAQTTSTTTTTTTEKPSTTISQKPHPNTSISNSTGYKMDNVSTKPENTSSAETTTKSPVQKTKTYKNSTTTPNITTSTTTHKPTGEVQSQLTDTKELLKPSTGNDVSKAKPNKPKNAQIKAATDNISTGFNISTGENVTVENTTGVSNQSGNGSSEKIGIAKTVITKIIIASSKTKPLSGSPASPVEIPILKNKDVSTSRISQSVMSSIPSSNGEVLIKDIPIAGESGGVDHQTESGITRSAAQLWRGIKIPTKSEESAVPLISSRNVKSTVEDADRWVASGYEPNAYSNKVPRENLALVMDKDVLQTMEAKKEIFGSSEKGLTQTELHRKTSDVTLPQMVSSVLTKTVSAPPVVKSNQTSLSFTQSTANKTTSIDSLGKSNKVSSISEASPANVRTTDKRVSSTSESKLPTENIYLAAVLYKKFIPPNSLIDAKKENGSIKTGITSESKNQRRNVTPTKTPVITTSTVTTAAQFISYPKPNIDIIQRKDQTTLVSAEKSVEAKVNKTSDSVLATTASTLEKLKTLLVYVQTILSSTKDELDSRSSVTTDKKYISTPKEKQNITAKSDIMDPIFQDSNSDHMDRRPVTAQETIELTTATNTQKTATDSVKNNTITLPTESKETLGTTNNNELQSNDFEMSEETVVKIPIFNKISVISTTTDPAIVSTNDRKALPEPTTFTAGLAHNSEKDTSAFDRPDSTSAIARILRKIYGLGNLLPKPTTTVKPVSSQSTGSFSEKIVTDRDWSTSTSSNKPSKGEKSYMNLERRLGSETHAINKSKESKTEKYANQNTSGSNDVAAFYGNEDMVGNFIVDSTSTLKPYTIPPATDLHEGVSSRQSGVKNTSKVKIDTKNNKKTIGDSVNVFPLLTATTEFPGEDKTS
ncbi:serine-rich adhesin for platelets-like [Argopecten irradians]|uniref:serine-rich adhesin for platelets-like n=1 Tax=Argopecten irradians TaxID=31199 RepID=UPI00371304AA